MIKIGRILAAGLLAFSSAISFAQEFPYPYKLSATDSNTLPSPEYYATFEEAKNRANELYDILEELNVNTEDEFYQYDGWAIDNYVWEDPAVGLLIETYPTPEATLIGVESYFSCPQDGFTYSNASLTSEFHNTDGVANFGYTASYTKKTYQYDGENSVYLCSEALTTTNHTDAFVLANTNSYDVVTITRVSTDESSVSTEDCGTCDNSLDRRLDENRTLIGNPINIANGNKTQTETDYISKYLKFKRYYNSLQTRPQDSNIGSGWSHSYSDKVIFGIWDGTVLSEVNSIYTEAGHYDKFSGTNSLRFTNRKLRSLNTPKEYYYSYPKEDRVYNENGLLTRIIHSDGLETTITRNLDDTIDEVIDPYGRKLIFSYLNINGKQYINSIQLPDGNSISYSYDSQNNLQTTTYQDYSAKTYHYEDPNFSGLLTGITDERGVRFATWSYDDEGKAVHSTHDGYKTIDILNRVDNQDGTRTVTVSNSKNSTKTIIFKKQNGVWRVIDESNPDGGNIIAEFPTDSSHSQTAKIRYDANQNPTENITSGDGTGNTSQYKRGNLSDQQSDSYIWGTYSNSDSGIIYQINEINRDDYRISYEYDMRLVTSVEITDLTNHTYPYNANGQIREWIHHYNSLGQLIWTEGPRSGVSDDTKYTYDGLGNLSTISRGDCASGINCLITTYNSYDANGRPLSITDPNGVTTIISYTPRGWVETVEKNYSATESALTTYEYDATGNIDKVTLPSGSWLNYEYNNANYLTSITNSLGESIDFTIDSEGKITNQTIKDASSNIVSQQNWVYSNTNRLLMKISGTGFETSYTYDNVGNPLTVTNDIGQSTSFAYDSLNRIATQVDAKNGTISKTYTKSNKVATITDQKGNVTTYTYNGFGNLIQLNSPDTGTETYIPDEAGNIIQKTRNDGVVTNYTYDPLNRVTSMTFPSNYNEDVDYEYDNGVNAKGKLTNVYYEHGSIAYTYNSQGLIDSSISVINGSTYETAYDYNIMGYLTDIEYPSGMIVEYTRDSLNRITDVNVNGMNQIANIQYLPFSNTVTYMDYENGVLYDAFFNLDQNPIAIAHETEMGAVLLDEEYSYELQDRISGITNYVNPSKSQNFTYSAVGELLTASGGYGSLSYTYDETGNRTSLNDNGSMYTYDVDPISNVLDDVYGPTSGRSFTHDANGNIIQDLRHDGTLVELSYNANNRLAEVTIGTDDYAYGYNPFGQRVLEDGKVNTYGQNGELLSVHDGVTYKEYVYLNGMKVAVVENGVINYIHNNYLGVPAVITDSSGAVVWEGDYKPFGEMYDVNGTLSNNIRFPGQYKNEESGYSYNYYRDYDPTIGRYLQSDPIGLNGGINTYGYVGGNPVNKIDLFGLDTLSIHSNVTSNSDFDDGHAWLTYDDGKNKMTIGLWPDGHGKTVNNGDESDVRYGLENNDIARRSRYYDLTPDQEKRAKEFFNKNSEWKYKNTCANWASDAIAYIVGEDVNAVEPIMFLGDFGTPRQLSRSIEALEKAIPTSAESPLRL